MEWNSTQRLSVIETPRRSAGIRKQGEPHFRLSRPASSHLLVWRVALQAVLRIHSILECTAFMSKLVTMPPLSWLTQGAFMEYILRETTAPSQPQLICPQRQEWNAVVNDVILVTKSSSSHTWNVYSRVNSRAY